MNTVPRMPRPQLRVTRAQPLREPVRWTPDEAAMQHTVDSLPARTKHIPSVTCIFGRRGQGKTLLATTMIAQLQTRFERGGLGDDHRVYTNYWTRYSDKAEQTIVEELQEFPQWLDDSTYSVLGIDEVAELLPSLRPMASDNLLTMGFLKQIRKRGVSVVMATQYPQEVTMGTLRQCDWFIRSEAVQGGRHLRSFWWDWPGNITGRWGRKYFPPERDTHDFAVGYSNTYRMWGSYRTEEIIAPRWAAERERIRDEQYALRSEALESGDPERIEAAAPREYKGLGVDVQAVIEDAAGSAAGVVQVEEIAEKLRRLWRRPRAKLDEIITRLESMDLEVHREGAEPFLLYDPPPGAPA